jgi:hypothetical protein
VFKDHSSQPFATTKAPKARQEILGWLRANKLPILGTLAADTYNDYFGDNASEGLVVIGALSSRAGGRENVETEKTRLRAMAKAWAGEGRADVKFIWVSNSVFYARPDVFLKLVWI